MAECSVTSFLDELVVMTSNLCPMVYLLSVTSQYVSEKVSASVHYCYQALNMRL